jgi:hypothetical protein
MYSRILSVTDDSAYFQLLISGKHNTHFCISLLTIPYPRRDPDKKKKMLSLRLAVYVHAHSMVYREYLLFLICNNHNPLFGLVKPHEILFSIKSRRQKLSCSAAFLDRKNMGSFMCTSSA